MRVLIKTCPDKKVRKEANVSFQAKIIVPITLALLTSYFLGFTPPLIAIAFLSFSLISYYQYARDKKAAIKGEWRVPENTLHILALFCGWPGALIAQHKFRHKTKKVSFRLVFWLTVLVNVSTLIWLHLPQGNLALHKTMSAIQSTIDSQVSNNHVRSVAHAITSLRTNIFNH